MKVVWAILCESAITDRDTNRVSLFNVMDDIILQVPPPTLAKESDRQPTLVPMKFELVALWARSNPNEPENAQGQHRIIGPNNEELESEEFEIDLTQFLQLRIRHHFLSLPYWSEGLYSMKIDAKTPGTDWQEMFEWLLSVEVQTDES